jgi:methyl-accepting chemotaxis protein
MKEETLKQLKVNIGLVNQMITIANSATIDDANAKSAALLKMMPGTFAIDPARPVRIGEQDTPLLSLNGTALNLNFATVDQFSSAYKKSVATIFTRKGEDFMRISTSLKKEDGSRAVGTMMGDSHPAYSRLMKGENYNGMAKLFGNYYTTKYVPIKDATGKVIGALFVGTEINDAVKTIEESMASIKVGSSGYVYVLDSSASKGRGELVVHPNKELKGKNILDSKDAKGNTVFKTMLDQKQGLINYHWKNPGESEEREKFALFENNEQWNWLIACSGYTEELYSTAISLQRFIFAASLVCAIILGLVVLISTRRFLAPLDETVRTLERIAEGDLTVRMDIRSNDEIGAMQKSCQVMIANLHSMVSKTVHISTGIAAASCQLQTTSEQIATGAEEVASQTNTVATASEEMAATSSDIARNCSMAADASRQTTDSANAGSKVVNETITGMNLIADRVRQSSKTVEALGARSEQIGAIIGTIEDIADQTNLLALNAAIEAARAGEQGRGFAVVADEVRALAERTTKATREIGEMIKAIQKETQEAVKAMGVGVQEVEKGAVSSQKSGKALEDILERINEVTMQVNQIATAAEQQTATTSEVTSNIQQITEVVHQTARGADETASAAAQLATQAQDLQNLVGRYRLA